MWCNALTRNTKKRYEQTPKLDLAGISKLSDCRKDKRSWLMENASVPMYCLGVSGLACVESDRTTTNYAVIPSIT